MAMIVKLLSSEKCSTEFGRYVPKIRSSTLVL